jgi:hypothetical protein
MLTYRDAAVKEVKDQDNKKGGEGDDEVVDDDEPQLLPLDDRTLAEAHNIDLNEEPVDYITDRAKYSSFLSYALVFPPSSSSLTVIAS